MRSFLLLLAFFAVALVSTHADAQEKEKGKGKNTQYAVVETNLGTFKFKLYAGKAPKTVENFVGLATGKKEYIDPKTGKKTKGKFYDGLTFHRIIPNFMIQGGDPLGTGTGGPGYRFDDERHDLKFGKPGIVAMANAGPNTNGSQFFITTGSAEWLNSPRGYYTIFGEVVEGMDVVQKIGKVKTGPGDRPVEPVIMKKVTITNKP
jgi:peptidyl-prolyl cis-trans isomerase A (cyclophilin A)